MGLTKLQRSFVTEYLANPRQPAAWVAVRAGYSQKRAKETASELLKDPDIRAAIESHHRQRLENVKVDETFVLTGLLREIERCISAGAGAWQVNGALKAYEMLGRHLRMFTERVEIDLSDKLMSAIIAGRKRAELPAAPQQEQKPEKIQ